MRGQPTSLDYLAGRDLSLFWCFRDFGSLSALQSLQRGGGSATLLARQWGSHVATKNRSRRSRALPRFENVGDFAT